jgi:hypothetical protein
LVIYGEVKQRFATHLPRNFCLRPVVLEQLEPAELAQRAHATEGIAQTKL